MDAVPQQRAEGPAAAAAAVAELLPPPPPPPPQLVVDRAPDMLQAVETSTSAISLQWAPVSCTLQSPESVVVEWNLNYELQMQQVRAARRRRRRRRQRMDCVALCV